MPLPETSVAWPPAGWAPIFEQIATWDALYTGEQDNREPTRPVSFHRSQYFGGLVGTVAKWVWGAPPPADSTPMPGIHVAIGSDLCQASSDLLFAEPPSLTSPHTGTQNQLQAHVEGGLITKLAEAAETCAALGGVYLRNSWDDSVSLRSFTSVVDADCALPEFTWGQLTAVTFWWRMDEGSAVYRQVERHELDGGVGVIEHALYLGTATHLGRRVPLTEHPRTAPLAAVVDGNSRVSTLTPGLAVQYVANALPNRVWRNTQFGRDLGRSDLQGSESLIANLQSVYMSWMRDLELGKGRIIVPEYMLEIQQPGSGASFNSDRAIYSTINATPSPASDGASREIVAQQFAIRVQEHAQTADRLVKDILRTAGYSAQTFGEDSDGNPVTATEIIARDRRTALTRDRKLRYWQPGLRQHLIKAMRLDRALFGAPVEEEVQVVFPEATQETMLSLATTAKMLRDARAASTQTIVSLVHPDWSETQIAEEVTSLDGNTAPADASTGAQPAAQVTV